MTAQGTWTSANDGERRWDMCKSRLLLTCSKTRHEMNVHEKDDDERRCENKERRRKVVRRWCRSMMNSVVWYITRLQITALSMAS